MPLPPLPVRRTRPRFPVLLALGLGLIPAAFASSANTAASDPWRDALRFEFNLASDEFAHRYAKTPDDARVALGHASALLVRQPRTQANIVEARAVFERIASTQPPSSKAALAARLLLARIAEDHLVPPRPDEARKRYEALLRDHAGQPLADQAAVHLALLAAYPSADAPAPVLADVLARIDALHAVVRTPEVTRELHSLQARLLLEVKDTRAALPHLLAARAIGFRQPDRNADQDLSIANIARETGDGALALKHYRAFLQARPRDVRASTVQRFVAELQSTSAPASTPASPRP